MVLLLELVNFVVYLVERSYLIERQPHDAALLGNGLEDALANPPHGIGDELEASRLVELLGSLNQTYVAFVNKVGEGQPLVLVLLGYRDHKPQVGSHKLVLGALPFGTALLDFLGELYLLFDGDEWCTANFYKIFVKSLA